MTLPVQEESTASSVNLTVPALAVTVIKKLEDAFVNRVNLHSFLKI